MKAIKVFEVVEAWYDCDAHSPGTAMRWDTMASFSNKEAADMYRSELEYLHQEQMKNSPESFSYNVWPEKTKYTVDETELKLFDTVGELDEENKQISERARSEYA